MVITPISRLKPGMTLASDLLNEKGVFLLPKATVLTEAHLGNLKRWGVIEADIEPSAESLQEHAGPASAGKAPGRKTKIPPEIIAAAKAHAVKRFKKTDLRDEIMREIFRLAVAHKAKSMYLNKQTAIDDSCLIPTDIEAKACVALTSAPPALADLIDSRSNILSLPSVLAKINAVVQNPLSTPEEAAEAIALDPGLSAKLLRLVNSSYYGFVAKVDTLSRAVTIVGSKQLGTLAMGLSVTSMFRNIPPGLLDPREFWKHSVACGIIAGTLAAMIDKNIAERAFVSGLLHDIGRLVMIAGQPGPCYKAQCLAKVQSRLLFDAENEVFGYNHAHAGAALMASWRFPATLENTVNLHHNPDATAAPESCLIHVADILANALEIGSSAECLVPPLAPGIRLPLRLSKEALDKAALLAVRQIEDTLAAFLPEKERGHSN
ncbi:MAG: HDOD domain-containing protein [Desulfovibrionaceae bacterium]|nr:HDOD domain-containing protein [Desulfovibrionaceae bacterium]MBF0512464.1 HDOD domain-containing protein [Desulfovibrionaceae bacterium]